MRPEIGREQAVQLTVGPDVRDPLTQGRREVLVGGGAVAAWTGSGRRGGFDAAGPSLTVTEGPETEIGGVVSSWMLMLGTPESSSGRLIVATVGHSSSSGRLIVGITGAELIGSVLEGTGRGSGLGISPLVLGESVTLMSGLAMS